MYIYIYIYINSYYTQSLVHLLEVSGLLQLLYKGDIKDCERRASLPFVAHTFSKVRWCDSVYDDVTSSWHTHSQRRASLPFVAHTFSKVSAFVHLLCHGALESTIYILCHIIIHTMSHHHTYYVTSSYILCHIIIHTMSHHHTYYTKAL